MPRQNKEAGPFAALRILSRRWVAGTVLQTVWVEKFGIMCKVQFHTCYLNSKSNCIEVNGFVRIYTCTAGRRTCLRGDREGRAGMISSGFPYLGFGIWSADHRQGFVLHCQRWRLKPCLLRDMWARFPLLPELECGGMLGRCCPQFTVQGLDTQPQGPLHCTIRRVPTSSVLLEDM